MKKYLFAIALLSFVILASGCTTEEGNKTTTTTPTKTYAQGGISFDYPESWEVANATTANAIVAVADPQNKQTLVVIQKTALPSGQTLKETFDATYSQYEAQIPNYQKISDGTLTVDGVTAYERIHKVNVDSTQKQERAVWLEKNGTIYVILCGALPEDFDKEKANFDIIINSFKVQ